MSPQDSTSEPTAEPSFSDFELDPRLLQAVADLGFETPTPIQAEAIPALLEGRDMVGGARTGSGKTAAFGLPLLHLVRDGGPELRALVLTPTRELALQVTDALRSYGAELPVRIVTIYGGASYHPQLKALKRGVDVVVGTPGRVLDLMKEGSLDLSGVRYVVLDEADEMLRMGFIEDVETILAATPDGRRTALFSATMPPPIRKVANAFMTDPVTAQVEERALTVEHIRQKWIRVPERRKPEALIRSLRGFSQGTTLVFAKTRASCAELSERLTREGIPCEALHGDLNQAARERALHRLRSKQVGVIVATDVAARGIDVEHIERVINLDLPNDAETYVHRIGRTGRAGRDGEAVSFVAPWEIRVLKRFEKKLRTPLEEVRVPSDADIAKRQREMLASELRAAWESSPLSGERDLLAELLEEDWKATDIAAAALHLLARGGGGLTDEASSAPPAWSKAPKKRRGRDEEGSDGAPHSKSPDDMSRSNQVELFFPIGRAAGVRPADLVGALTNELGLSGRDIGRITILDRKSFVGLPGDIAELVLADYSSIEIRGRELPLARSFGRDDRRGGPRSGGPRGREDRSYGRGRRDGYRDDRDFDRDDRGDQRNERGYDRDDRGYDRNERGYERNDRGYDRDDRGYDRDDRGRGREDYGYGWDDPDRPPRRKSPGGWNKGPGRGKPKHGGPRSGPKGRKHNMKKGGWKSPKKKR